jgi:hypothetical protein
MTKKEKVQKMSKDSDNELSVHSDKENLVSPKSTTTTKQAKQAPKSQMPPKSREVISDLDEQGDDDESYNDAVNAGGSGSDRGGVILCMCLIVGHGINLHKPHHNSTSHTYNHHLTQRDFITISQKKKETKICHDYF